MAEIKLKLAHQCRLMKVCGVDIVGNPDASTLIGLNEEGIKLVENLRVGKTLDTLHLNENQSMLINELSANGFFIASDNSTCVKKTYLHVTSHCNLKCPGCYSFETDRNVVADLTLDELKFILDNLVNAGLTHIVISGGEPFIRDDLETFLSYARSKQQIQYIECITNGTSSLDRYRDASKYLDKLTFSLDSSNGERARIRPSNVFHTVVKKLIALQAESIPVSIVFTIHHENIAHCSDLMSFANSINVKYRFSIFAVETSYGDNSPLMLTSNDYQVFHDFVMSHQDSVPVEDSAVGNDIGCMVSCGAGETMVAIASNGDIYPCHMFVGRKQLFMGNALHNDIKETVNCTQCNPFLNLNVDCIKACKNCHVRYICGGGCRFRAYASTGSMNGSDPLCRTYIDNIESCIHKLLSASL